MSPRTTWIARAGAAALAAAMLAACRTGNRSAPPIVQPGAPGQTSREIDRASALSRPLADYTAADVAFMQGMIHHHAQALDMTALVPARTASDDMRKLALRIEISQADEIRMMREWLMARGQDAPDEHAHHAPGAPRMPGMLTAEEMSRLAAATGEAFDRLFLDLMIKHHLGAIKMVDDLFAAPGSGQEAYLFAFASDVVADQRAEIERMAVMLKERQK